MKEIFCSYSVAHEALRKGLQSGSNAVYVHHNKDLIVQNVHTFDQRTAIKAPTTAEVQRWLREEHNIDVWAQPRVAYKLGGHMYLPDDSYNWYIFRDGQIVSDGSDCIDYEEALDQALKYALELI